MLKWAYTAVVRPTITYASHIWANNLTEVNKKKLKAVNRLACLMMGKVQKSTPTAGMEVIFNLEPYEVVLEKHSIMTFFRISNQIRRFWTGIGKVKRKGHLLTLENKAKASKLYENGKLIEVDERHEMRFGHKKFEIHRNVCDRKTEQ